MVPAKLLLRTVRRNHHEDAGNPGQEEDHSRIAYVLTRSNTAMNASPARTMIGSRGPPSAIAHDAIASSFMRSPVPGSILKTDTRRPTSTPQGGSGMSRSSANRKVNQGSRWSGIIPPSPRSNQRKLSRLVIALIAAHASSRTPTWLHRRQTSLVARGFGCIVRQFPRCFARQRRFRRW